MSNKRKVTNWRQIFGDPVYDMLGGAEPEIQETPDSRYLFRDHKNPERNGVYVVAEGSWRREENVS